MLGVEQIVVQLLKLTLLALVGYVAVKFKSVPENSGVVLSKIVVKITAPILIFMTLSSKNFTMREIQNGISILILGLIFIMLGYLIAIGFVSKFEKNKDKKNIFVLHAMFGNVVFLAYPLLASLYGKEGISYAVFFNLSNDILLWTLGIFLLSRGKGETWKLRDILNSASIAFIAGFGFVLFGIRRMISSNHLTDATYEFFYSVLHPLGETTIYLSMIFIGMILAGVKIGGWRGMLERKKSFLVSCIKQIIVPLTALGTFLVLDGFFVPIVRNIVVLQLAMPCATIIPALASTYNSDYKTATENVFVSTLMGLVTLPMFLVLLNVLFG